MKLRNKLIPILSATSVAATLAPVALTSCGNAMVNLINGYTPTIKKAIWEDFTSNKKKMLTFYAQAVNENPQILVQDLLWNEATQLWYQIDLAKTEGVQITPTIMEASVTNVNVRLLNCQAPDKTEYKFYTLSFDFVLHYVYDQKGPDADITAEVTTKYNVKNIPFTINRNNTDTEIGNITDYDWMVEHNLCFAAGMEPTDWVIQPLVGFDEGEIDPKIDARAFNLLERNGFEWFVKYNSVKSTFTVPYGTYEPKQETANTNILFDHYNQFKKASQFPESLEYLCVSGLYSWFVPSYYLSDIVDETHQLAFKY